jgi:hypothetical protein
VSVGKGFGKRKSQGVPRVESVPLASLERKRRSKHRELMQQVLKELGRLSSESALKVPLGNNSAKDLRSAVVRAVSSQNIEISSTSDGENLYVWKKHGSKTNRKQEPANLRP